MISQGVNAALVFYETFKGILCRVEMSCEICADAFPFGLNDLKSQLCIFCRIDHLTNLINLTYFKKSQRLRDTIIHYVYCMNIYNGFFSK